MKNSFEDKLNKLRELHDKNSMIIDHEVDYIISKYGTERKIDPKKLKTYILIIFIILCVLLGLVNAFNSISLYYLGIPFFLGGLFVGLSVKSSGLILLFTHGGTGLGLMLIPIIKNLELKVYLTDNPTFLLIYLIIIIVAIILAIILTVLYNLNDRLTDNIKIYSLIFIFDKLYKTTNDEKYINFVKDGITLAYKNPQYNKNILYSNISTYIKNII